MDKQALKPAPKFTLSFKSCSADSNLIFQPKYNFRDNLFLVEIRVEFLEKLVMFRVKYLRSISIHKQNETTFPGQPRFFYSINFQDFCYYLLFQSKSSQKNGMRTRKFKKIMYILTGKFKFQFSSTFRQELSVIKYSFQSKNNFLKSIQHKNRDFLSLFIKSLFDRKNANLKCPDENLSIRTSVH